MRIRTHIAWYYREVCDKVACPLSLSRVSHHNGLLTSPVSLYRRHKLCFRVEDKYITGTECSNGLCLYSKETKRMLAKTSTNPLQKITQGPRGVNHRRSACTRTISYEVVIVRIHYYLQGCLKTFPAKAPGDGLYYAMRA